jgi:hypothetical protein
MEIQANWTAIQKQIDEAPHGQKSAVVARLAGYFGCSKDKIYREMRGRFGPKKTVEREKRIDPGNRLMQKVFDMKTVAEGLSLVKREPKTEWCIGQLQAEGIQGAEALSVSTVNRRINEMGFRERQPTVRLESDYANQVHMIDFTRSKYFQLFEYDPRRDDYMLIVSGNELHYKQGNARLRTWICQYMDDYSRLRKSKMYAETGESAFLGLDHLSWAWAPEEDDHLMRYLPLEMLRSDNGAFRKATETKTAMDALDINLTKQRPRHHGGTAKIENRMRSLWKEFEGPLALQLGEGGRMWMSEYNALLYDFCVKEQQKQHPFHKEYTKGEIYQQSLADRSITQRTTDVDVIRLACRVEKRKVDDHLRISLNNEYYAVPQYVDGVPTIGKQVYVHINKYGELTGKLIDDLASSKFELEAWEPLSWGEYGSFKHTPRQKREDQFEEEAPSLDEIIGRGSAPIETDKEQVAGAGGHVQYMKPETEKAEPDSVFSDRIESTGRLFRSELDGREYIGIRLEAWGLSYGDVAGYFAGVFEELPVSQQELDRVIEEIQDDYDSGELRITG